MKIQETKSGVRKPDMPKLSVNRRDTAYNAGSQRANSPNGGRANHHRIAFVVLSETTAAPSHTIRQMEQAKTSKNRLLNSD